MRVALLGPIVKDVVTIDGETDTQIGSPVYYSGNTFASLGIPTSAFATYDFKDHEWFQSGLTGVELHHIPSDGTMEFNVSYSSDNPDKRQVHIHYFANSIPSTEALLDQLCDFDYVVAVPLLHDNISPELLAQIHETCNVSVVYGNFGMFSDVSKGGLVHVHSDKLIRAAPYMDFLFLDEEEAKFVTNTSSVDEAAGYLQKIGADIVIITKGSNGSQVYTQLEETYAIPAYPPTQLVDPTGAGDTYLAAFIRGLELFDSIQHCGEFAAMTATMSLENRGAFRQSLEDVYRRLDWN